MFYRIRLMKYLALALGLALLIGSEAFGNDADKEPRDKKVHGSFVTTDSTFVDFTETMIEGKMKAPSGFFLQGRQSQSLQQMVRLRSKFRRELRNSRSAVKSLVK